MGGGRKEEGCGGHWRFIWIYSGIKITRPMLASPFGVLPFFHTWHPIHEQIVSFLVARHIWNLLDTSCTCYCHDESHHHLSSLAWVGVASLSAHSALPSPLNMLFLLHRAASGIMWKCGSCPSAQAAPVVAFLFISRTVRAKVFPMAYLAPHNLVPRPLWALPIPDGVLAMHPDCQSSAQIHPCLTP